jgi:hypothetical protein
MAAGSFDGGASTYSTVIQIINPSTTAVSLTATFYNPDSTPSTLPMTTNSQAMPNFSGTLTTTVPINGVLVIATNPPTLDGPGVVLWGRLVTSAAVTISSSFEVQGITVPGLKTRVGVDASENTLRRWIIPRVRNTTTGRDAGFAIVNTGTTPATVNAALKDADGTNLSLTAVTFQPGEHKATFAAAFFTAALPGTSNYQYMVFDASAAQFASMGLSVQGENLSSVPVSKLD